MELPDAVTDFVEEAIVLGHPLLPRRYPADGDLATFQAILPDAVAADRWLALCCNESDEPFLVDQAEPDGPVYFASGVTTHWEAIPVADSLAEFTELIARLQDLEADPCGAAGWIEHHLDTDNDLWAEVAYGYRAALQRLEALSWPDGGRTDDDQDDRRLVLEDWSDTD
jgi:hypothetical protein